MPKISGTVYRYASNERVSYASLKAYSEGKAPVYVTADDDGDFTFPKLSSGKWTLVAMDEYSMPGKKKEINLEKDITNIKIELQRMASTKDSEAGKAFFNILLGILGVLIALYVVVHIFFIPKEASTKDTFIWTQGSWWYLELILWSLAGILVNKIINVGWYLRSGRFYKEGMVMHVAHLVTTPLLVLVTVIILSLVELTIKIIENEVILDLSDPKIMIAVTFLLGTSPWPLWNFVQGTADKITGGP